MIKWKSEDKNYEFDFVNSINFLFTKKKKIKKQISKKYGFDNGFPMFKNGGYELIKSYDEFLHFVENNIL